MKAVSKVSRLFGVPLVSNELTRQSRRWKSHIGRCLYLLVAASAFSFFWYVFDQQRSRGFGGMPMSEMVVVLFGIVSWGQFILLSLGAAQTSSLMISEERSRDTLEVLLTTPLGSFAILLGKFISVLLRSLLYILAAMPFFAVLLSEGGLSLMQILGVSVLTLCMVSICSSVAMLGALINRRQNAGVGIVIGGGITYAVLAFLGEYLPAALPGGAFFGIPAPVLPEMVWLIVNPFKAFYCIVSGQSPAIFAAEDWVWQLTRLMLWHLGIACFLSLSVQWVCAILLRPVAQLGKLTIWQALWRRFVGIEKVGTHPRRRVWEQGEVRPWASNPLLWRSWGSSASPFPRVRRFIVMSVITVAVVFGPFVVYVGEFAVRYSAYTIREVKEWKGIPPLPEHPVFEGGAYARNASGHTVYWDYEKGTSTRPWRNKRESYGFLEGWSRLMASLLVGISVLMIGSGAASATAKNTETKRMAVLLSTPLTDREVGWGFAAEGCGRWLGLLVAVPVIAVVGSVTGLLPVPAVIIMLIYQIACGGFFAGMGLRFGITSKTVRWANSKIVGLYVGLGILYPMFAGMLMGLADAGEEAAVAAVSPSPIFLGIWSAVGFGAIEDYDDPDIQWMMAVAAAMLMVYAVVGVIAFSTACSSIRRRGANAG